MADLDLSQFDDIEIEGVQEAKKKGVVDIIFLMDVSGSMGPAIAGVAKNISKFIETLKENNVPDWRAKVYTFSDIDTDSADVAMNLSRKFESDPQAVVNQLAEAIELVKKQGGGDEPESSMDALYKTVEDINESFPHSFTERTRVIVAFTDATPKKIAQKTIGADVDGIPMLAQNIISSHVSTFIYGPSHDDYNTLAQQASSYVTYHIINPQGENPVEALKKLDFVKVLETLGKTVSQASLIG